MTLAALPKISSVASIIAGSVLIGFTVVLAFLFTIFGIHKHFPRYQMILQFVPL